MQTKFNNTAGLRENLPGLPPLLEQPVMIESVPVGATVVIVEFLNLGPPRR